MVHGKGYGPKPKATSFSLKKYAAPWEVDTSREAGYIAGILDGEGALTGWDRRGTRITFGQNPGVVVETVTRYLKEKGFDLVAYEDANRKCVNHYLAGNNRPALRAVGMFRPERFLEKQDQMVLGQRKYQNVKVASIEPVGEQEVIALETDSHTFFAEGFATHNCDFKQAEGRVIAYLAQDEYLRQVFNNSKIDIFDELSNQLYGVGNWRKEVERIRTKAFFYGLSYGREAYSIAMEFGLSVSEAERRMQEFLSLIPATAAWQKATRDEVLAGKDLITPFGRRRRFWLITEHNKKDILNEALSFLPQSTSSDICLDALIHIRPRLRGIGFVRLTIHDALVAECHESRREEVTGIMTEEMMAAGERFTNYVPFPVDVSYGKTWGDL
jgi:hypothetical protein